MAEISFTTTNKGSMQFVTWAGLTTNDTGVPYEITGFSDKTVQIFGDFGTNATLTLQGSNDPRVLSDPSNAVWATLTDPQANNIAKTAAALEVILENPRWIRPSVASGTNPSLTVVIASTRSF